MNNSEIKQANYAYILFIIMLIAIVFLTFTSWDRERCKAPMTQLSNACCIQSEINPAMCEYEVNELSGKAHHAIESDIMITNQSSNTYGGSGFSFSPPFGYYIISNLSAGGELVPFYFFKQVNGIDECLIRFLVPEISKMDRPVEHFLSLFHESETNSEVEIVDIENEDFNTEYIVNVTNIQGKKAMFYLTYNNNANMLFIASYTCLTNSLFDQDLQIYEKVIESIGFVNTN